MDLFSSVTELRGIGPTRAKQLQRLHIETLYDLIAFFPRAYEDRTKLSCVAGLEPGTPACFEAMVISNPQLSRIRKGMELVKVRVADETGRVDLVFFNQPYVKDQLVYGESYRFYGALRDGFGCQMQNPAFEKADAAGAVTGRILPIYPLTAGISNKLLGACVRQALAACAGNLPDILPASVQQQYDLCPARFAYETVHLPSSFDDLQKARRRLVFEEFFVFSAGLAAIRTQREALHTKAMDTQHMEPFYRLLPFRLTNAQQAAIDDILRDLSSCRPMNRLVQGDVGSGKTMVAAAACFCTIQNGHQAAFMAPTEILAQQHYSSLTKILEGTDIKSELLIGSITAANKRKIRERLKNGEIDLLIGTNAIISDGVEFKALGLAVTDEQHRFGVRQRAKLSSKGDKPHTLVMSATPIPRTLGLIIYGDLDISLLDELPPGRQKISTFLVGSKKREGMYGFIKDYLDRGLQAYIVCPTVEENELNIASATEYYEKISAEQFKNYSVGLLHGKMKAKEKDAVMRDFLNGKIQLLVSTTVIEVGVDVSNAVIMAVENAERFGFSQLHQLRGRVGRGSEKSYCFLVSDAQGDDTLQRLRTMCRTNNGFEIADMDLKLRGPGDFFGSRQHGLPEMHIADLADMDSLSTAQQAADEIEKEFPGLQGEQCRGLRAEIKRLFSKVGAEGMN